MGTIVPTDEGDMTRVMVAAGTVDATSWHPVWVEELGDFTELGTLKPGEHLRSPDGSRPEVKDVRRYLEVQPVYDLTYHVLANSIPVLVHNCGDGAISDEVMDEHILPAHDPSHADSWKFEEKSKFEDWAKPEHIRNWAKLAMRKPVGNMNIGTGLGHRHVLGINSVHPIGYDVDGNSLFRVAVWAGK